MKTDLPGRFFEFVQTTESTDPNVPSQRYVAVFDSFDVGESELKLEHFMALTARVVPLLQELGISDIFVAGAASHTGSHKFNVELAIARRQALEFALLESGFADILQATEIEPTVGTLHEDLAVQEHKRHRAAGIFFDTSGLPDGVPIVFPPPDDLDSEAD